MIKTLLIFAVLGLAGCVEGEKATTADLEPIAQKWGRAAPFDCTFDFSNATAASNTITVIWASETCSCTADVTGDASSGSISVHTCTHVSGAGSVCTGATSEIAHIDYTTATGSMFVQMSMPLVTNTFQLFTEGNY